MRGKASIDERGAGRGGETNDAREVYADALRRAIRHAAAHVDSEEAREIAHHVAVGVVRRVTTGAEPPLSIDAFIHRAVLNRLRDLWRDDRRRRLAEGAYQEERSELAPAWAQPGADLESRELHGVIDAAVASMTDSMRRVFLAVRRDRLSYKEAAEHLGIGVGTVHTQLSRANAILRQAVADYQASTQMSAPTRGRTAGTRS